MTEGVPSAAQVELVHTVAREVFGTVGTKWALPVIEAIGTATHRYADLYRGVPGISHRLLTVTLRRLEREGLVHRRVHPTVPPRTEYRLTPAGLDLHHTVNGFCRWSRTHLAAILAARSRADHP